MSPPTAPHDAIYTHLLTILAARHASDTLLTFETLPAIALNVTASDGPQLLQDGNCIAITKRASIRAFIRARHAFFTPKPSPRTDPEPHHGPDNDQLTLHTTSLLLLHDSEHLTAANYRKHYILHHHHHHHADDDAGVISRELSFTASLLASPMHRTAKSPTLWFHRRWVLLGVLDGFYTHEDAEELTVCEQRRKRTDTLHHLATRARSTDWGFPDSVHDILKNTEPPHDRHDRTDGTGTHDALALRALYAYETALVFKAAECHPCNYYAWDYLRRITASFSMAIPSSTPSRTAAEAALAAMILGPTHAWCLRHVRDVSAWSFLGFLVARVGAGEDEDGRRRRREVVEGTVAFARRIGWWGEALWVFVEGAGGRLEGEGEGVDDDALGEWVGIARERRREGREGRA